ncbi:zinc transporter ZIP3 isoform X2 [Varanus komodoensis]|uniref:zinc transporter ZIP3 isoform X2 n=1 Tax=Varanus komodoensis TaxID=61221 RepID=UPI001CF79447|nr:zinc transporter ZIP3 isoform X2 [Varanus komodoensis]
MALITTMGLPQDVFIPTHLANLHVLWIESFEQDIRMSVGDFYLVPLSWSDHHLLQEVLKVGNATTDYPLAETLMLVGFFMTVFVEQLVLTFRKEKPSFIDLETFNASSDIGSDSECESSFIGPSWGRGSAPHGDHGQRPHVHGLSAHELARASPLRLFSLVFALAAHSIFEGLALGLQEEGAKVTSLFLGVAVHETLVAVALGTDMAKSGLTLREAAKPAVTVSLMIPLGITVGLGIESARSVASSVISVLLQGIAGGTFLFVTFFEILSKELEEKSDRLLKMSAGFKTGVAESSGAEPRAHFGCVSSPEAGDEGKLDAGICGGPPIAAPLC